LMRALPRVVIVTLVLCLAAASQRSPSNIAVAALAPAPVVVITQARISTPGGVQNAWWQLVTSPDDPDKLLACQLQTNTSRDSWVQAVLYGSDDAGETWRTLKTTDDFPNNSEGSCALGSHGRAYFTMSMGAQLPKDLRTAHNQMYFWSSPDFGKTWHTGPHLPYTDAAIIRALPGGNGNDRVFDLYSILGGGINVTGRMLTVFNSDGTHTQMESGWPKARCGSGLSGAPFNGSKHSLNDLPVGTALLPARPSDCKTRVLIKGVTLIDNHTVGAIFQEFTWSPQRARIAFSRLSTDGKTASTPVVVAPLSPDISNWMMAHAGSFENGGGFDTGLGSGPAPDSSGQRVYITWVDRVKNQLRIFLASSSDKGATWSAPRAIDDATSRAVGTAPVFPTNPSVAVNAQGIVAIKWEEFAGNCSRVAFSRDGGKHFEPSVALNPCEPQAKLSLANELAGHIAVLSSGHLAFDHSGDAASNISVWNMRQDGAPVMRDMSIAAAQDGSFYALWANQTELNDDLHIAHITLPGYTSVHTERRQAALRNARCCFDTKSGANAFGLDFRAVDYDPATQEFTIGATLVVRRKGVTWPLVVRVAKVTSKLGLTASNADNGLGGVGAAWVFDGPGSELPSSMAAANFKSLPPGQYAFSNRTLRFRLANPDGPLPAWGGESDNNSLFNLKVDLLTPGSGVR
jgi:hypothetical protein